MMCSGAMPVWTPSASERVRMAMTISSNAALPARSPMPLMAHSICRAPPITPSRELATARPRSLWQWVEKTTVSAPGTFSIRSRNIAAYWVG